MKTKQRILITIGLFLFFTQACKKDKTPKIGVPELTTTEVSNILATTAMSGGSIADNGGAAISASGICWSKSENTPTISDDTTKNNVTSGSFSAMLKNLSPSSKYYVRAYATNREGTGYGNVVTFNTGNAAPVVSAVTISGDAKADALLTGNYIYNDSEGDAESGTTFQWYAANDGTGAGEMAIAGAVSKTFRIQDAQQNKYIRFGVTPKSSSGSTIGSEVKSAFIGAIGEGTTVTFIYNGNEVTYGIIIGPSGKKWLDRNLGASRVAQALNDYQAYGDLFQWGRLADGHQLIIRTTNSAIGVTGTTSTVSPYETSNDNIPLTNKFIINKTLMSGADWRVPQESNLWQGKTGVNNPCPEGWRVPTKEEWIAENFLTGTEAYNKLKLTINGMREYSTGNFIYPQFGFYWSSSVNIIDLSNQSSYYFYLDANSFANYTTNRSNGVAIRCIK